MDLDVVTVYHRDAYLAMSEMLHADVERWESGRYRWIGVDNRTENRGFAAGCNLGASRGEAPIIAFLNPDARVRGPFLDVVQQTLERPGCVITGHRFDKPQHELDIWGVRDWVCGAAMFVQREFWESEHGFDERFWMYFEETDLIRRAEARGLNVTSVPLPIEHASPEWDEPADVTTKHAHFSRSGFLFWQKWQQWSR